MCFIFVLHAQEAPVDAEVAVTPKNVRKRKTTHSDPTHGSFFLRVGAIGKTSDLCINFIYILCIANWILIAHVLFHYFGFVIVS